MLVVEEGQGADPLACDAVCEFEGRRARLAAAFGVDPAAHVPVAQRARQAEWSGALLSAARRAPAWVAGLERQLAAFCADRALRRVALEPMPRAQRALVHALAAQYGLASAGAGAEPRRAVELLKPLGAPGAPPPAPPSRLLSAVAPTVPEAEIAEMLREAEGFPLRVAEAAPSADLAYYFRRWEGARLDWQGADAALVRFARAADRDEALAQLGGGVRGIFRIDRAWKPRAAAAPAAGGAAPWAGAAAAPAADAVPRSGWTAAAAGAPGRRPPPADAPPAQPKGWVALTGRAPPRPAGRP
jgi:hypothetical protein